MLGDLLDNRYRIIRTLSKGGFGQTYIAEDTRLPGHPYCVLKHLEPVALDSVQMANARRLFETEAIALGRLGEHPQIPRLLAYFEEKGDFYIVQDLVRGYPLSKELKEGVQWSEADIYRLLHDVLSILVFVHDRGVIHRDVKPDNLIRRQPDRALVLVDFGSVKQIRTQTPISDETGHTIAIGTMGYMAMEQARGRPRPNSDLYSLGIIGVQAATGVKPRFFKEDFDTGELVWRDKAEVSDDMAAFLTKMVAYHFKDRYSDAWDALRALEKLNVANTVNGGSSTNTASNHWPNAFTLNHVPASTHAQLELDGAAALTPFCQADETIADPANALAVDRNVLDREALDHEALDREALDHEVPHELASPPTFIELPEPSDIAQTMAEADPCTRRQLPRATQTIANTVTLDMGGPQPETDGLEGDRAPTVEQPLASPPLPPCETALLTTSGPTRRNQPSTSSQRRKKATISSPPSSQRFPAQRPPSQRSPLQHPPLQHPPLQHPPLQRSQSRRSSAHGTVSADPQRAWANPLPLMSHWLQSGADWLKQALTETPTKLVDPAWRSLAAVPNSKVVLAGSISTLVVLGLGMRGYQDMQQQRRITALVQSIESQHGQHQYEQCWQQAQHLQAISHQLYDTAIELEGRCALAQAQQLAEQQDFMGAIAMAKAIPEAAQAHHQESQTLIREWFVRSLEQAEAQYAQGSVNAAIATAINLAHNIPSNHPLQAQIQLTALKWNLEQSLWLKAQRLLDDRQWQTAIDQAQPLLTSPPFEHRVSGLIAFAEDNLAIENQQQDRPEPIIVPPLIIEQNSPERGAIGRGNSGDDISVSQNNLLPRRPQK
ncbi:MAG: protein kinase [Leptolyngbyaceae cyanobacterium]